jgi:hypothetical protein
MLNPTTEQLMKAFTDITGADEVEIMTDEKRGVIWVNVNAVCVLRICRIKHLEVDQCSIRSDLSKEL